MAMLEVVGLLTLTALGVGLILYAMGILRLGIKFEFDKDSNR
jgi:MFS superfamily sulfate permease-like transporter